MDSHLYDAILVPGGGVRADYELPFWTVKRLDKALKIQQCRYFILLSAGTPHKPPPLNQAGFPIYESEAAARYLISRGVDPERILYETASFDTIGNAYFAKVIHIDPLALKKLLIVTSDFHMERARAIFNWLFSPRFSERKYCLNFATASDFGVDPAIIKARKEKEKRSLEMFYRNSEGIKTLTQLHAWLFTRHSAYTVSKIHTALQTDVLKSY